MYSTQGILKTTNLLNSKVLKDKIFNSRLDTQIQIYDTQLEILNFGYSTHEYLT